ncbi:ABC-2 type transport system permease protein [Hydrogenispora ethanolica]|uniref:ABC-2 type transport system permease protein n=1 Tax=Hydrogenispora ethanolica TaxID=1082276 RepID=A0A4R1RC17_HYDET|nr:ABC transporter permease [Hydrogenispora ethanolica]TCL63355.1 ABC-2 type transport system permease protein [Hydrogenispora ethanolica]
MKAYLAVLKLRLINGLQYRTAALAGIATQFFWGFLFIMIYEAFYSQNPAAPAITLRQLVSYIWLQQAFLAFIMIWFRDQELLNLITSGNVAYELCRPAGIYGLWFSKLLAQRLAAALLRCFPILIAASLLPQPYRLIPPPDPAALGLFVIALILGLLVLVALSMFMYLSVFVTMSPAGSLMVFSTVGEFLAGMVIPLPLMPERLQRLVYLLPFRLTADLPFRIYSGNIPVGEAWRGIGIQLVWLAALVILGRWALGKVLRKVVIQGG